MLITKTDIYSNFEVLGGTPLGCVSLNRVKNWIMTNFDTVRMSSVSLFFKKKRKKGDVIFKAYFSWISVQSGAGSLTLLIRWGPKPFEAIIDLIDEYINHLFSLAFFLR
jgi:hypothetical protein